MDALKIEKPILAGFDWRARTDDASALAKLENLAAMTPTS
jgi:hypothetical protein